MDFVKSSGVPREDIYFTSKLKVNSTTEHALRACKKSIENAGTGYLDLYLIHGPLPNKASRLASWKALEMLYEDGLVKVIKELELLCRSGFLTLYDPEHWREQLWSCSLKGMTSTRVMDAYVDDVDLGNHRQSRVQVSPLCQPNGPPSVYAAEGNCYFLSGGGHPA
jgi:Aldo/keto reductase family